MFHLDNESGVTVMPDIPPEQSKTIKYFTDGSGAQGASYPAAYWFNMVQSELINILNHAGIEPSKTEFNQITKAISAMIAANNDGYIPWSMASSAIDSFSENHVATSNAIAILHNVIWKDIELRQQITNAELDRRIETSAMSSAIDSYSEAHVATSRAVRSLHDALWNDIESRQQIINAELSRRMLQAEADGRYLQLANAPNFVVLYPGGSAGAPPILSLNQRIAIDNPFGTSSVIAIVEIYCASAWFNPYFTAHNAGGVYWRYGVGCAQVNNTIIVASAAHTLASAEFLPNFSNIGANATVTTAPYRVKVWKIK